MDNLIENSMKEEISLQCTLSSIRVDMKLSDALCYYPDIIQRASTVLLRISDEHSVFGKLNVIWQALRILTSEIKERILLRKC